MSTTFTFGAFRQSQRVDTDEPFHIPSDECRCWRVIRRDNEPAHQCGARRAGWARYRRTSRLTCTAHARHERAARDWAEENAQGTKDLWVVRYSRLRAAAVRHGIHVGGE